MSAEAKYSHSGGDGKPTVGSRRFFCRSRQNLLEGGEIFVAREYIAVELLELLGLCRTAQIDKMFNPCKVWT
jgi:hypothetical protein